jgi:multiple sugar transport system ATP-binding protein
VPIEGDALKPGDKATIGVRPEHLTLADPQAAMLTGEVQIAEHLGGETFLYVSVPSGETVVVEVPGQIATRSGERLGINVPADAYHLFSADGLVLRRRDGAKSAGHDPGLRAM